MEHAPLPVAVSNNAVASLRVGGRWKLYSFAGLLGGKTWRDVTNRAFEMDLASARWREISPVPGPGRLAGVAASVSGAIYLFGGYTVAEDGSESSTPEVLRFDPGTGRYEEFTRMPTPVDDAVALVYRDRYVYLISGWHDRDNVDHVQVLDTVDGAWLEGTRWPGAPVFGHSGGIVGNALLICDGVMLKVEGEQRLFPPSDECHLGRIDGDDPAKIIWQAVPPRPHGSHYRAAAAGIPGLGVVFIGGGRNPYNYDGVGYDGEPTAASSAVALFSLETLSWTSGAEMLIGSMDHRGLAQADNRWFVVGGMVDPQRVSPSVVSVRFTTVSEL